MMPRFVRTTLLPAALAIALTAGGSPLGAAPAREEPAETLASTGWTAAYARLAGLEDVRVLAPLELQHPPEYELRPSDLEAVARARLVIYAGYEVMVEKLVETAGRARARLVQVETRNDLPSIQAGVRRIAEAAGTEEEAERNLRGIGIFYDDWKRELAAAGLEGAPVLVQALLRPLAAELGFEIRGVFGPGPLEPRQIARLSATQPSAAQVLIVIDNWHNPGGRALEETLPGVPRVELLNFPGAFGTRTLPDLLRYNREALAVALGRARSRP